MITLHAYAKLNLSLDVLGKRSDGYHELDMIMQSISLYDTVTVNKADGVRVHMDRGNVDTQHNTAYIAAQAFCHHTGKPGADIVIQKRIPSMAGLGGSSADAAAVLIGLNRLYDTALDDDTLAALGKSVGADVPFALTGGTARAKGIGELLTPLTPGKPLYFVLVKPHQGVSTAQAFAQYRQGTPVRMNSVAFALQKGDLPLFHRFAGNALGMAALTIAPDVMTAGNALMVAGAEKALMTGSGSTMFAVFDSVSRAQDVAGRVRGNFELCGVYSGMPVGVQKTGETNE